MDDDSPKLAGTDRDAGEQQVETETNSDRVKSEK
jgi:hypothetical protein